jgi:hypothetical protein
MDVVKAGINDTINKAGQNSPTANLPMGGFKHTQVGAPSAEDQYMRVREVLQSFPIYMTDTEAASSVSLSVASSLYPTSLSAGMWVRLRVNANKPSASASPVSFHLNGLSANIRAAGEDTLWPGAITSGQVHELVYDGSAWQLQNPGAVWVTRDLGRVEGRLFNNALVTTDTIFGVSADSPLLMVSVELRRSGDDAEVRLAKELYPALFYGATYAFETVPTVLYISTLPDWMRPDARRFTNTILVSPSAGAGAVGLNAWVSTDGKVVMSRNLGAELGSGSAAISNIGAISPFTIIYRLKG